MTLKSVGIEILSYHVYIPSFGDWGFHLAGNVSEQTLPKKLQSWFHFDEETLLYIMGRNIITISEIIN